MTEPVPDLRAKQWGWKVIVGLAAVGAIAIGIAVIKLEVHDNDPGGDACDHVTALGDKDGSASDEWDARVRAAARTLEGRVVAMTVTGDEPVKIERDSSDATCRELFRVYYKVSMYSHFTELTECVGKAATVSAASRCLAYERL